MRSVNFVILGDYSIAEQLGKKGTESDMSIYDRKSRDSIYTFIVPSFPEKIQTLVQAINMADYVILNVDKLDRYLGEIIIALDSLNVNRGFILATDEIVEKLDSLIKDTALANFEYTDLDSLKRRLDDLEVINREGDLLINVDHAFDVKGVGAVILGIVRQGKIKVYDELEIMPLAKNVMIKSIQLHGKSVEEAESPARVGLALKGIKAQEISRGDIIAKSNTLKKSNRFVIKFEKNKFSEPLSEKQMYMLALGLQVKTVKVKIDKMIIEAEKEFACNVGDLVLLLKPDSKVNRIVGRGIIEKI